MREYNPKKASVWCNGVCVSDDDAKAHEILRKIYGSPAQSTTEEEISRLDELTKQITTPVVKDAYVHPSSPGHHVHNNSISPSFTPMPTSEELEEMLKEFHDKYMGADWGDMNTAPGEIKPMNYHGNAIPQLKCKCWRCDKEIKPTSQFYDYGLSKYLITVQCHGQLENAKLTEKEIEKVNEQGFYYFFM